MSKSVEPTKRKRRLKSVDKFFTTALTADHVQGFDIETIPDPDYMSKYMPEVKIRSNLKDPKKIEEAKADAIAKQKEMAAVDPHVSRIMSCGFIERIPGDDDSENNICYVLKELSDESESKLITNIFKTLERWMNVSETKGKAITFNGSLFDWPFIMRRAAILRLRSPDFILETNRYKVLERPGIITNHLDLRMFLASTMPGGKPAEFASGNLDYYAKLFLGQGKQDFDHGRMHELWKAKNYTRLVEINMEDISLMLDLYEAVRNTYLI